MHRGRYRYGGGDVWLRSNDRLAVKQCREFHDRPDARWRARAARAAGMRYAILTAKHHDGVCLFDSGLTVFRFKRRPGGRDYVWECVNALRGEGIKVALHYFVGDLRYCDCAARGDRQHLLWAEPSRQGRACDGGDCVHCVDGQVRELLTGYGRHRGERWGTTELVNLYGQRRRQDLWNTHPNPWGYGAADLDYESAVGIVRTLATTVFKRGNLALNFSPDARGRLARRFGSSDHIFLNLHEPIQNTHTLPAPANTVVGMGFAFSADPTRGYGIE